MHVPTRGKKKEKDCVWMFMEVLLARVCTLLSGNFLELVS